MILRRSQYVHFVPLAGERVLCVHAMAGTKLVLAQEVVAVINYFDPEGDLAQAVTELPAQLGCTPDTITACAAVLIERGILSRVSAAEETEQYKQRFADSYGRDPVELVNQYQRERSEGAHEYWAVGTPRTLDDFAHDYPIFRVALLGDCDLQVEVEFLRTEARKCRLDLRVVTAFQDDNRLLLEARHDVVIVGALKSRHFIAMGTAEDHAGDPAKIFLLEAREMIERLREHTPAPILLNNLPVPTVEPLGLGDRGTHSHRNRFRNANLALEDLVAEFPDVYLVDIDAALNAEGKARLLDDSLLAFTHFGSLGWMLQRPPSEFDAVHGIFPNLEALANYTGGPYQMEAIVAREHLKMLMAVLGIEQKKCVIVDLDGTLWPGVLAETGRPFNWSPEVSGPYSFVGLYFGLHEALKCLMRRGIVLACVSKNDEAIVRELWRYESHYPHDRLLHLDDFVTTRINWTDKVQNIRSIADELGFELSSLAFVDDNQVERARVKEYLPDVLVVEEDPFGLRRFLLSDARFQTVSLTAEAAARTQLVKAQLRRSESQRAHPDEQTFIESLQLVCDVRRLTADDDYSRLKELFDRTTQFSTTGRKFTNAELQEIATRSDSEIFILHLSDKFGDYGLVGGCVVQAGEIIALAISCRALGLGVEHRFMKSVLDSVSARFDTLTAPLIQTPRNLPARHIYKDHGFIDSGDGRWVKHLQAES